MPPTRTIHWNPPDKHYLKNRGRTRCGRRLENVEWRKDQADVTCNNCLRWPEKIPE